MLAAGRTAPKPTPNLSIQQNRPLPSKENQRKGLGFAWISFAEWSRCKRLRRPPARKTSSARSLPASALPPVGGMNPRLIQHITDSVFRKKNSKKFAEIGFP
jgi:hypothetical protein